MNQKEIDKIIDELTISMKHGNFVVIEAEKLKEKLNIIKKDPKIKKFYKWLKSEKKYSTPNSGKGRFIKTAIKKLEGIICIILILLIGGCKTTKTSDPNIVLTSYPPFVIGGVYEYGVGESKTHKAMLINRSQKSTIDPITRYSLLYLPNIFCDIQDENTILVTSSTFILVPVRVFIPKFIAIIFS